MKRKQDEFAETREFAVALSANKIEIRYSYDVSIWAIFYNLPEMYCALLRQVYLNRYVINYAFIVIRVKRVFVY